MRRWLILSVVVMLLFLTSFYCTAFEEINCRFRSDATWVTSGVKEGEPGYFEPYCQQPGPTDIGKSKFEAEAETSRDPELRLIPYDVRKVDVPPEIIAYANVENSTPPDSVIIQSQGDLWRYHDLVALMEKGDWISATCTNENTRSIGVRIEGDDNDGWVAIQVDGVEVWRGSVYGEMKSDNMFLNYIEYYYLPAGQHTIRLENLGIEGEGKGDDVAIRYFGCSSQPVVY
jgi:hypothetical protein